MQTNTTLPSWVYEIEKDTYKGRSGNWPSSGS